MVAGFAHKFQRLTFEEPIAQCHRQAWTDRIKGCHEVFIDLQSRFEEVKQRCRPFEVELYQELLTALDGYEMTMQAYLATDKNYQLGKNGKLEMDSKIEWACENRRHFVLDGVCTLLDPQAAPIFDESAAFARLETFAEKKNVIHRRSSDIRRLLEEQKAGSGSSDGALDTTKIAELDNAPPLPDKSAFEKASQSDWDFDRVIYYLTHAESIRVHIPDLFASRHGICIGTELHKNLLHWLNEEVENIRARQDLKQQISRENPKSSSNDPVADSAIRESKNNGVQKPSRIPLYYALGVLDQLVKSREDTRDLIHHLGTENVEEYKKTLSTILELEEGSTPTSKMTAEVVRLGSTIAINIASKNSA